MLLFEHQIIKETRSTDIYNIMHKLAPQTLFLSFISLFHSLLSRFTNARIEAKTEAMGTARRPEHRLLKDRKEFDAFIGLQLYRFLNTCPHFLA